MRELLLHGVGATPHPRRVCSLSRESLVFIRGVARNDSAIFGLDSWDSVQFYFVPSSKVRDPTPQSIPMTKTITANHTSPGIIINNTC